MSKTSDKLSEISDGYTFLKRISEIILSENVVRKDINDKCLNYKDPQELKKLIDFSIGLDNKNKKPLNEDELIDVCRQIIKYSVNLNHPLAREFIIGGKDLYSVAASWIIDSIDTAACTFDFVPVFTLMEKSVIDECCNLVGFHNGDGIFCAGGLLSNLNGLLLARYKYYPEIKHSGLFNLKPMIAFTSETAHFSTKKSMNLLGLGDNNLIIVKTNDLGQMSAADLEEKIKAALVMDKCPFFVNATAGTTVIGSFDDINAIADVCQKYKLWLHVDGCWGGSVILSDQYKHLMKGVHRANSVSWDPHKLLGAPIQCSMFLTREKDMLHPCNSTNAYYLFQTDKHYDVSIDMGEKSVQCTRKADVFKFWLMLKARGKTNMANLVDNAMKCTEYITEKLKTRDGFRLLLDKFEYTSVCFWYIPRKLRDQPETLEWWNQIYKISRLIMVQVKKNGRAMINASLIPSKNIANIMRISITCHPISNTESMDAIIAEIELVGEQIIY